VLKFKPGEPISYSDVQEGIKSLLQETYMRENFQKFIENLKSEYNVKIDTTKLYSIKI